MLVHFSMFNRKKQGEIEKNPLHWLYDIQTEFFSCLWSRCRLDVINIHCGKMVCFINLYALMAEKSWKNRQNYWIPIRWTVCCVLLELWARSVILIYVDTEKKDNKLEYVPFFPYHGIQKKLKQMRAHSVFSEWHSHHFWLLMVSTTWNNPADWT